MRTIRRSFWFVAFAIILQAGGGCTSQDRVRKDYKNPTRVRGRNIPSVYVVPGIRGEPREKLENPVIPSDSMKARVEEKK